MKTKFKFIVLFATVLVGADAHIGPNYRSTCGPMWALAPTRTEIVFTEQNDKS